MTTHIVKFTTGNKIKYQYFKGDRVYRYTEKDNLPKTMVNILLNGECYETTYTAQAKVEKFR